MMKSIREFLIIISPKPLKQHLPRGYRRLGIEVDYGPTLKKLSHVLIYFFLKRTNMERIRMGIIKKTMNNAVRMKTLMTTSCLLRMQRPCKIKRL